MYRTGSKLLFTLAALAPASAFAHETQIPHTHPHGASILVVGLAAAAGIYWYAKHFVARRNEGTVRIDPDRDPR